MEEVPRTLWNVEEEPGMESSRKEAMGSWEGGG